MTEENTTGQSNENVQQQNQEPQKPAEQHTVQQTVQAETAKPAPAPTQEEKQQQPHQRPPQNKANDNVVLVGKKPTMSYVMAAVTQFSDGMDDVHIKARGRSISRAVDVAEVVRNRFVQGANTQVNIGTQEITDDNNNKINVSTIDIMLKK